LRANKFFIVILTTESLMLFGIAVVCTAVFFACYCWSSTLGKRSKQIPINGTLISWIYYKIWNAC